MGARGGKFTIHLSYTNCQMHKVIYTDCQMHANNHGVLQKNFKK